MTIPIVGCDVSLFAQYRQKAKERGANFGQQWRGIMGILNTLPLHPKPGRRQSFSSYLMTLANLNGITSGDGLAELFFPDRDRRAGRTISDFPPVSFGSLVALTLRTEEELRATTLYHIAAKFGRSTHPQAVSRFMAGSIASHLRFCPPCIAEKGYYSLDWRFTILPACPRHHCFLVDCCSHCGQGIPLFSPLQRIGFCPHCNGDLRKCSVIRLTDKGDEAISTAARDVRFLITPFMWEQDVPDMARRLGKVFEQLRTERKLGVEALARHLGLTRQIIAGIESGNVNRGASFGDYHLCAEYLGISLRSAFSLARDQDFDARLLGDSERENNLLARVKEVYADAQDPLITHKDLAGKAGVSLGTLKRHPKIRSFLAEISKTKHEYNQAWRVDDNTLIERVIKAGDRAMAEGAPISQRAISKATGISRWRLRYTPAVKQYLDSIRRR